MKREFRSQYCVQEGMDGGREVGKGEGGKEREGDRKEVGGQGVGLPRVKV